MGKKRWNSLSENRENEIQELMRDCSFPRPIAMFFVARGFKQKEVIPFLDPKLSALSDPFRFPGMKAACERLWAAIRDREPILIHGDYDTDGVTATALLQSVLENNGAEVFSFIPHRFDDGYGFTPESLEKAMEVTSGRCKVLVTVDCGITSSDAVKRADEEGVDVIVTDHHDAAEELPAALALINPKLYDELKDLQVLSGAGVAFKLCHAFVKYGRQNKLGGFTTKLEEYLDLVALGTVADIVPLMGENRTMVKYGIQVLRKQMRPGVRALIENSHLKSEIQPSDITFRLAPRINAAGRVGDASAALQLLQSDDIVKAYECANLLEKYNGIRQEKEQEIYEEAKRQIEEKIDLDNCFSILVYGRDWHQGVIGIVASRLARDYNRPAIVLTLHDDEAHGSGRSIADLNLIQLLGRTSHLLERFGGHPMAVGVGLKVDKIKEFSVELEKEVRHGLTQSDLDAVINYEGSIQLEEVDSEYFRLAEFLNPFGHSNTKPIYRFNELEVVKCFPVGRRHCRGVLKHRSGNSIDFIAFNRSPDEFDGPLFDVLATPQMNNYYQVQRPQLQILDLTPVY